ncbi:MAG: MFS transporter [Cyanothece sp. SIO1E1]|nr:MFS transporter [Cyanothece sp. SIO1E1]
MPTFILVWFGQVISLIGSGLTGFALGVWVYQTTGSVTQFSLIYLFTELPAILVAPVAGAIADRWDRRWVMILSDTGSGLSTVAIALLLWLGQLEIWQIYLAMAVSSTCKGFQQPAYYASPTLLVAKEHFGRANGMIQLGKAADHLFAPILAGVLVGLIQVRGVILIDFATFCFALFTLLVVRFPKHQQSPEVQMAQNSLWQDIGYGWNYILARPGLLMMLMFFVATNFTIGLAQVLVTPMVLSFADAQVLGRILSLGGSGWLLGAILMSTWGGPKRRVYGVFGFELLLGVAILVAGLRPSPLLITAAAFTLFFCVPMITGCSNAIWQVKVAPAVQGRVFAMRGAIAWASFPLAYLLAGPLADQVFQPLLSPNGLLASSVGQLIGVGAGRGIGLLFIIIGIFIILATSATYQYPRIRLVEDELPDAITHSTPATDGSRALTP